jgi:hypothetical protein
MAVISFSFTSIHANHDKPGKGKIKVSNNVSITTVDPADINFGDASKGGVKFGFEFKSNYEPKLGSIVLKGKLIYLNDTDKVKKIFDMWKKEKKVPPEAAGEVINNILNRCNVEALIMSRDVGLPSPIPLPKMQVEGAPAKK